MIHEGQLHLHVDLPADHGCAETKTHYAWATSSNMDTTNIRAIWPTRGPYEIPALKGTDFWPTMLAAWHLPKQRDKAADEGGALHFYLDDYRFERVWRHPDKTFARVQWVGAALTPDFSIYEGTPLPVQMWQIYRQRWMGAFWQFNGIEVIPAVRWAEPPTWDFVFEGLPEGGTYSIGELGPGSRRPQAMANAMAGFKVFLDRVKPCRLAVYGKLPEESHWLNLPPFEEFPTFWETRRIEREEASNVQQPEEEQQQEGSEEWQTTRTPIAQPALWDEQTEALGLPAPLVEDGVLPRA